MWTFVAKKCIFFIFIVLKNNWNIYSIPHLNFNILPFRNQHAIYVITPIDTFIDFQKAYHEDLPFNMSIINVSNIFSSENSGATFNK